MYSTPSVSSPADLVDAIATAAAAAGWTITRNVLASGIRTLTIKHASSDYLHFVNDNTVGDERIRGNISTGYDSGQPWNNQPGRATDGRSQMTVSAGPFTSCYIFANSSPSMFMHVVLEYTAGIYRHMSFGVLEKFGAYTGGTYIDFTNWSKGGSGANQPLAYYVGNKPLFAPFSLEWTGQVRADVDGDTFHYGEGVLANRVFGGQPQIPKIDLYYELGLNAFSGTTPMTTLQLMILRPSNLIRYLGTLPKIRFLNMQRFAAGDEFTIGGDTWKVFPWVRKGNVLDQPYSHNYAYAFMKEV